MYSGQLFCLRKLMPKDEFDGIRVTVVDNYQGEENDIILLSLVRSNEDGHIGFLKIDNRVCVAMSRAKKGFYAIGNFELLAAKSRLWKEVTIDMKKKGQLGEGLLLYCQNHPDNDGLVAAHARDFGMAPEGGCNQKCDFRLPCGHVCEMYCHVQDQDHKTNRCMKPCDKMTCKNRHRCRKPCYQKCGDCQEMVVKKIPQCGHMQRVPCHKDPTEFTCEMDCAKTLLCGHKCASRCGYAHTTNCKVEVEKKWPCGHKGKINCYQKNVAPCPYPCDKILGCEHRCFGTCGTCFKGKLHKPCINDCIRILVCGHECTSVCNNCPPCTRPCENRCTHSKCRRRCGELCAPCMEPCTWNCPHYKCSMICSEPCDRPRCNTPCTKKLRCGHPCIGLCGEKCPTDCRICDNEKVTKMMFGDEDEPDARFVVLEDCPRKCIFEYKGLDHYMDERDDEEEIKLKQCPVCRTTIRKSNRYGTIINRTLQDIEAVKRTVLFNEDRIKQLEEDIRDDLLTTDASSRLTLARRLKAMQNPKSEHALVALKNQLAFLQSLQKLAKDWESIRGLALDGERTKGLDALGKLKDWVLEERLTMSAQESRDAELEISRSEAHVQVLLHQQKLRDLSKTLDPEMKVRVRQAEKLLAEDGEYTERSRLIVERCLLELKKLAPLTGLHISEDERLMIVNAMALPLGHWFKCPQGHVYAIADCGGATIESRCPECKSSIGGANHALRGDNEFAGEMDGAQHPAWSEMANMVNFGFNVAHQ